MHFALATARHVSFVAPIRRIVWVLASPIYDRASLGGYRTNITEQQLRGAPAYSRDRDYDWSDRTREKELHDHYRVPYYWGI